MTIYTPSLADKKPEKDATDPEVVTEPLTGEKEKEAGVANVVTAAMVSYYLVQRRRSALMHMVLAMIVLLVLAFGAIGSVLIYRHLNKKVLTGRCGVTFYDEQFHATLDPDVYVPMDSVEEDFQVCETEMYEEMHTPAFDEVRETYLFHDFYANYTVIIDHIWGNCYVTTLRRNIVRPTAFILDIHDNGFAPRTALVIRQDYMVRMHVPRELALAAFGGRIGSKCMRYNVVWVERSITEMHKRSAASHLGPEKTVAEEKLSADEGQVWPQLLGGEPLATYAILTNNQTQQQLYKIRVHQPQGIVPTGLPPHVVKARQESDQ